MSDLDGKVILVTGGANGIGEAIVRSAVSAGAKVAIVDLNLEAAQKLAGEVEGTRAYAADVSSLVSMEEVCAAIIADFGKIDGAVNNAGIGGEMGPVPACTTKNWDAIISVNLTGVFNSVKAELVHMLPAGGGSIVNMASMGGLYGEPNLPAYIASKHGVVGLTKSVAIDHAKEGIRCNAVCPSFIKTPMTMAGISDPAIWDMIAASHPGGELVTVEEVAEMVVFLLSGRSSGINGTAHPVDKGVGAS